MDLNEQAQETSAPKKQSRWKSGRLSLLLGCLSAVLLLILGIALLVSFRSGSLAGTHIRLARMLGLVCAALALIGTAAALAAFFARWRHRGCAALGLVLCLLIFTACGGGLYAYAYIFGGLNHDAELNALSRNELYAAQQKEDGEIIRSTIPTDLTMPPELTAPTQPDGEIVDWIDYTYEDIPEELRPYLDYERPPNPCYLLDGADQISTYMIFGLDKANSSDAMILLALDRAHQKIKLISLARDTYACNPAWGPDRYTKLAYPYTYNGVGGALMAINYNFSLGVEDYVTANFGQLVDIIDYLGGVEVELNDAEAYYLRRYYGVHSGTCVLDGEAALTYARMRHADNIDAYDGELKRSARQRKVITSIMESVRDMPLTEFPGFVRTCLGMVTTSLTENEILDLVLQVVQGDYTIESYALVGEIDHWHGLFGPDQTYYYVYDFNRASDWIYRTVYEEYYLSGYDEPIESVPVASTEASIIPAD